MHPSPITEEVAEVFKKYYTNTPESLDVTLMIFRKMGISPITSIKIIMHQLDLTLQEANEIVSGSKTWNTRDI
jgi:hypothetical protein